MDPYFIPLVRSQATTLGVSFECPFPAVVGAKTSRVMRLNGGGKLGVWLWIDACVCEGGPFDSWRMEGDEQYVCFHIELYGVSCTVNICK